MASDTHSPEHSPLGGLLRSAIRQSSTYFIGIIGVSLIQFVLIPIYTRIFNPTEYGILNLALLLVSIGTIIFGNWIATCVTRFLPYYQRIDKTPIFYSSLLLSLILSLIVFFFLTIPAFFFLRGYVDVGYQKVLHFVIALIPFSVVFQVSLSILRIKQQSKQYVIYNLTFASVGATLGVLLAVFLKLGSSGILLGQIIIVSFLGMVMFKGSFLSVANVGYRASSSSVIRQFALYGFPAAASTIGTWLLSGSDRYVIGYFKGTADVGLYSMSHNVGDIILLITNAFTLAVVPALMLAWESENREATSYLLSQFTRIFFLVGLPAVGGISILARPIFGLLTTESYYSASGVVPLIALGNFTYGLCLLSYTGLQTAMKSNIMARNWIIAGVINIVLNVILVPRFGYGAAAFTCLMSYVALLFLNVKSANKYLKWALIPRTILHSCLASLIMVGVIILLVNIVHSDVIKCIIGIVAGIIVYFTMLFILREFTRAEILEIKSMFNILVSWVQRLNFFTKDNN
jgi:O-antigen/teichoic acid export membrane protein